jgi:lipopolysaccharide biosynthesis regulator YciM
MRVPGFIRRLLGRDEDEEAQYRCIHCGDEFETNYHDCPSCGDPYVAEIDR